MTFFHSYIGVENQSGVTRDSAILEVERREKPEIEIYPSDNQNVVQGGSVLFQCRVMSGIPNPKITWRPLNGNAMAGRFDYWGCVHYICFDFVAALRLLLWGT